jgi:hypothetical protein
MITLNGHQHEFAFELHDGKAANGRFKAEAGSQLVHDLSVQYGKDANIQAVIQQICDSIKLYQVVMNKTTCVERIYKVYAIDEADAITSVGYNDDAYIVDENVLPTDWKYVTCKEVTNENN